MKSKSVKSKDPSGDFVKGIVSQPEAMIGQSEKLKQLGLGVSARRNYLRQFREYAGLSLEKVAKSSGLSKSMISKFELGHRDLSPKALKRLERALASFFVYDPVQSEDPAFHDYVNQVSDWDLADLQYLHDSLLRNKYIQEALETRLEVLKRLVEKHPEASIVKQWYEAELAASKLRQEVYELDILFRLDLGRSVIGKFMRKPIERAKKPIPRQASHE